MRLVINTAERTRDITASFMVIEVDAGFTNGSSKDKSFGLGIIENNDMGIFIDQSTGDVRETCPRVRVQGTFSYTTKGNE